MCPRKRWPVIEREAIGAERLEELRRQAREELTEEGWSWRDWIPPEEAAESARRPVGWIYGLIHLGKLEVIRDGNGRKLVNVRAVLRRSRGPT